MPEQYDVIIVGGGTAGLKAALHCAKENYKTAMIEPGVLGGTCLNTGCIPSKAMLHASELYQQATNLEEFGLKAEKVKIDYKKLIGRVKGIVEYGVNSINMSVKNPNLTLIKGKGTFLNSNTLKVGDREVSAKKILVSTGSKNHIVPIKGLDKTKYYTNDNILEVTSLPKSVILIGGGYISLEYATFFNELGAKVTVLERAPRILSHIDENASSILVDKYTKEGMDLRTNEDIREVIQMGKKVSVTTKHLVDRARKEETLEADILIVATGRKPATDDLNLDKAGIKTEKNGGIRVNDYLQTSNKKVWAVGDCTGQQLFAHAATKGTHVALPNMLDNKKEKMPFSMVPWAVFTNPPIAGIGLTEAELQTNKIDYGLLKANFARAGRTRIIGHSEGILKVFYNKKNKNILGVVMIGIRADDIIHEFVAVMNSSSPTIDTIKNTIHIHPTVSEVIEALK